MSEILKNKIVKCRKKHNCFWCGELIQVGETAHYQCAVVDGDFGDSYMHPECQSAEIEAYAKKIIIDGDHYSWGFKRGSIEER